MNILFSPLDKTNGYISLICESLCQIDNVKIEQLSFRKPNKIKNADLFWLNWYEDLGSGTFQILKNFIIKILYFRVMEKAKGAIVVVMHNKCSHDLQGGISRYFMKFILRHSDKIVILCDESISVIEQIIKEDISYKIIKIPHPAYHVIPKTIPEVATYPFIVLFFGLLRPYKNIEILLKIAKLHPHLEFIIAGKPIHREYAQKLTLNIEANCLKNVQLILGYISEDELDRLIQKASIMALPYHLESSLNSGAAIYAFSKGINVVMPRIGTIKEIDKNNLTFSYEYATEDDHVDKLEKKILEAYSLYRNDYKQFVFRASEMQKEVAVRYSTAAITEQMISSGLFRK